MVTTIILVVDISLYSNLDAIFFRPYFLKIEAKLCKKLKEEK